MRERVSLTEMARQSPRHHLPQAKRADSASRDSHGKKRGHDPVTGFPGFFLRSSASDLRLDQAWKVKGRPPSRETYDARLGEARVATR